MSAQKKAVPAQSTHFPSSRVHTITHRSTTHYAACGVMYCGLLRVYLAVAKHCTFAKVPAAGQALLSPVCLPTCAFQSPTQPSHTASQSSARPAAAATPAAAWPPAAPTAWCSAGMRPAVLLPAASRVCARRYKLPRPAHSWHCLPAAQQEPMRVLR